VYEIRGGMATTERNRLVEEWKTRDNGIIVATLASLTEGVNLQHSSLLLFAEQDYLPSTIQQAIARARRAGQTSRVRVINVLAKDSIDTAVNKALAFRDTNIRRALLETLRENP
jgi:SNF2 family DNA or RNA helicase